MGFLGVPVAGVLGLGTGSPGASPGVLRGGGMGSFEASPEILGDGGMGRLDRPLPVPVAPTLAVPLLAEPTPGILLVGKGSLEPAPEACLVGGGPATSLFSGVPVSLSAVGSGELGVLTFGSCRNSGLSYVFVRAGVWQVVLKVFSKILAGA